MASDRAQSESDDSRKSIGSLEALAAEVIACERCPRLVKWRKEVAFQSRAHSGPYFSRGLPGFGDPRAELAIVGLAPAAHGGNRTGRMFTGDRSGDFLFAALYRAGYASMPTSVSVDDGLTLHGCYITGAVRCAPPENKPTPEERTNCAPFLERELELLSDVRVIIALGAFALDALMRQRFAAGDRSSRPPKARFSHALETDLVTASGTTRTVIASYHPSQRNVFTGRLTVEMFDAIFDAHESSGADSQSDSVGKR